MDNTKQEMQTNSAASAQTLIRASRSGFRGGAGAGRARRDTFARRRGNAVLELGITLMVLFYVCYGTIEFGYYFFVKNAIQNAAREGARAGIVAGAVQSDITTAVTTALTAAGLTSNQWTTTTTPSSITNATFGTNITVSVTGTWGTVANNFRPMGLISSSKTLIGSAVMRKEG